MALQTARNEAGEPVGPYPVVKADPCCCGSGAVADPLGAAELEEGAGFGHPESAADWSWGSPLSHWQGLSRRKGEGGKEHPHESA